MKKTSKNSSKFFIVLSVILISMNLRPALTSMSPLLHVIMSEFNLNTSIISLITAIPLFTIGLFSPIVPRISQAIGYKITTIIGLILLIVGIWMRTSNYIILLWFGTVLVGISLSILNVVLPGIIKHNFKEGEIGLITSIYTTVMGLFAAIAPSVSSYLTFTKGIYWGGAIKLWIFIPAITIVICLISNFDGYVSDSTINYNSKQNIWKSKTAWQVSIFMGLQSVLFYSLVTWLSTILLSTGYTASQSGFLLTLMGVSGLPTTFIVPLIANRLKNQKIIVLSITICYITGLLGLYFNISEYIIMYIILLGLGQGASISLSYALFALRTKNPVITTQISGMAQSIGYLLASLGPFLLGIVHDLTNSWDTNIIILLGVCLVMMFIGLNASEDKYIEEL